MKVGIAQYVGSYAELDRQIDYTSISDDPENYHRCVARERTLELEACREMGVPCFLILDSSNQSRFHISGYGAQNSLTRFTIADLDRNPVKSLSGYRLLLRSNVSNERYPLQFIESLRGTNIADWASQQRTLEWYKHVRPEFLKRRLSSFPLAQALAMRFEEYKDTNGLFFAKTNFKVQGCAGLTADLIMLLGYNVEMMPDSTDVIVSEPLSLLSDSRGKLEYRCYVVNRRVSTISRYIDYDTDYVVPPAVFKFADSFVVAHQESLPACYVLDVVESDRGVVVIEINGIVASGRYERNCFRKLLDDLRAG